MSLFEITLRKFQEEISPCSILSNKRHGQGFLLMCQLAFLVLLVRQGGLSYALMD